jgi:hypothetical protein
MGSSESYIIWETPSRFGAKVQPLLLAFNKVVYIDFIIYLLFFHMARKFDV